MRLKLSSCALTIMLVACGAPEGSQAPSCVPEGQGYCGGDAGNCCAGTCGSDQICHGATAAPQGYGPSKGDPACPKAEAACLADDASLAAVDMKLCVADCEDDCADLGGSQGCDVACCQLQCQGTCQVTVNEAKAIDDRTCATAEHICNCTCNGKCAASC